MQDQVPSVSVGLTDIAPTEQVQPTLEVAVAPPSSVGIDSPKAESRASVLPDNTLPGREHKMQSLDETIAALSKQEVESPLLQMARDLIDRAAAIAHVVVDKAASTVVPFAQAAAGAGESTMAKAQDYKETATEARDRWVGDARTAIQVRPLTAIGIAALAGVAISLIFLRPPDSDS